MRDEPRDAMKFQSRHRERVNTNPSLQFSDDARLKKQSDFVRIRENGRSYRTPHFFVGVLNNSRENSRLGITVSKKVSRLAVERNKLKRQIREIFRQTLPFMRTGKDVVITARSGANQCSFSTIDSEIQTALKKLSLI